MKVRNDDYAVLLLLRASHRGYDVNAIPKKYL